MMGTRFSEGTYHPEGFLEVVLIMGLNFRAWYLLWIAVSADGTYYGPRLQTVLHIPAVKL